jgi:hypothetical protein
LDPNFGGEVFKGRDLMKKVSEAKVADASQLTLDVYGPF